MNDLEGNEIAKQEEFAPQLQTFEERFIKEIKKYGLPTNDIFVSINERQTVFYNIEKVLKEIPKQKDNSIYLSKFLAAIASGLFDAALNYLWDETILAIRKRVVQYDVAYFYDNATTNEDKRKKLKGQEDIDKLDDSELITGARNIDLISELGLRHLDYIRYMRNWASAAHPNQNQLTGLQLLSWLETCIKEVIAIPIIPTNAIEIKKLLKNIKTNALSDNDAKQIASFFSNLSNKEISNLASGFFGIFIDVNTLPQTRHNINCLLPYLWVKIDEETRQSFGVKYGKFVANNDEDKKNWSRQFLEIVDAISYIPVGLKAAEIDTAIQNLCDAHHNIGNFNSEPIFAKQLKNIVGQTGKTPKEVRHDYIIGLIEVFLTNGNGVAWNAEPIYIQLIQQFDQDESLIAILSFTNERIASKLQLSLCKQKYKELINLVRNNISSPPIKELIKAIDDFAGPLDKMKNESHMKSKITNLYKILQ